MDISDTSTSLEVENNPWSTLSTVTSFDKGNNSWPTKCANSESSCQNNGPLVESYVTSSTSLLIGSLIYQLCALSEKDPTHCKQLYLILCEKLHKLKLIDGTYDRVEFELMRGQYQQALFHLVSVARAAIGSKSTLPGPRCLVVELSRYRREFKEVCFIASGGFGNVFKALNKLDGIEYAIKKITVRSGRVKTILKHLEEVKTIAKLNHTNIVPYKSAWIESNLTSSILPELPSTEKSNSNINSSEQWSVSYSSSTNSEVYSETARSIHYSSSHRNTVSREISDTDSDVVSFRAESRAKSDDQSLVDSEIEEINVESSRDESESCSQSLDNKICHRTASDRHYAILYIQMALCDKTMREWLNERREPTSKPMLTAVVTQILSGLQYIHSLSIVHHDIKPSNIFISTSGQVKVQLGDFGLACPLQRESHDSIIGTHMYAAPEQLQGQCDPKSDLYSVGIVLLELLNHMSTAMELSRAMESLKAGKDPSPYALTHPEWGHILSQLVQKNPQNRPTASQLLEDLKIDKDLMIAKLQSEIEELRRKVANLEANICTKANVAVMTDE